MILAGDLDPDDAALIARLVPATPSRYHRLNPLTKAVIATTASAGAFVLGGYIGPIAIIIVMLALAYSAGELGRLTRVSLLLTVPIAVSVVLVNALTHAGTTVLVVIGPFDVTLEGVDFAGQIVARLFAISASIGLFILTTDPRAFVFDLERRGAPPRVAFIAVATIDAIPTLVDRAAVIGESQRARGLDAEGNLRARLRGVMPLIGPVILTSLTDVEERSLALETRAFSRPGRRHLLWSMPDTTWERVVRWVLVASLVGLVGIRIAGMV